MRTARALRLSLLLSSLTVAALVACSGSDGAPGATGGAGPAGSAGTAGAAGAAGSAGNNGTNGTNGGGGEGGAAAILTLSERAQKGLQISPVALNLDGKTPAEIEAIGLGSYLANSIAECADCHSPSPDAAHYFIGGVVFPIDGAGHTVVSRNLTPDTATGLKDTAEQFLSAERNGTDILNASSALVEHPWQYHRWLSDSDINAVYSFLLAIPPISNAVAADNKPAGAGKQYTGVYNDGQVDRPIPADKDFLGGPAPDPDNILRGLAIVPLDIPFPPDAAQLALFGRGSYIINAAAACSDCHTNPARDVNGKVNADAYFGGGRTIPAVQFAPLVGVTRSMSANLLGVNHGFFSNPKVTFETFLQTITHGIHGEQLLPDGGGARPLAFPMPWQYFRNMTATDLEAVYTYLHWIATNAPRLGANDKVTQPPARWCDATHACFPGEICSPSPADPVGNSECVGGPCDPANNGADCGACQTCTGSVCTLAAPDDPCLFGGK